METFFFSAVVKSNENLRLFSPYATLCLTNFRERRKGDEKPKGNAGERRRRRKGTAPLHPILYRRSFFSDKRHSRIRTAQQ
jgi:hypothetical protein